MALYIDDVKMSVPDALRFLKVDASKVPFLKKNKEFVQKMDRDIHGNPKRDQDGNYQTKRKIAGSPQYSVFVKDLGYEVRVRIANTQRKVKDGEFEYTPKLASMDPGEDGALQINDQIEFTFWFLHPWCLQSPFHQTDRPYYFEYKDEDLQSKMDNDFEEARADAIGIIVGRHSKPMRELRTIAKGLNITGVDDMTDDVLRKKLREEAIKNPQEFINKVDSREIIFDGYIQDAIDKKVIKLETLNGMQRWYLNGKEIVPVAYGMDAIAVLREQLVNNAHLYLKEIQDTLAGSQVADALNNPALDELFSGSQTNRIEQPADIDADVARVLKEMGSDEKYAAKIKSLASYDYSDSTLHHAIRKSYETNKLAVDAYLQSLHAEVPAL